MLDQKFVITMCERSFPVNVAKILAGFSKIVFDIPIISPRKIHRLPGRTLSVGNDKESRECLKFPTNNS
jgi:hypothetical protein